MLDWLAFADAWRGVYQPAMEEVRSGRMPFCKLDVLHRRNLERILPALRPVELVEEVGAISISPGTGSMPGRDVPPGLAAQRSF